MISTLDLLDLNSRVLFIHNRNDRMTKVNEPPFDPSPRIYIGLSRMGNIVRFRDDLDDTIITELNSAINENPGEHLAEMVKILGRRPQISNIWIGPVFVFPKLQKWNSKAIQILPENKDLLSQNFPFLEKEFDYKTPVFAILEKGEAISACHSSRSYSKGAAAGVYTVEEYRGLGYGSEVTKAWALELQQMHKVPFYGTEWVNYRSQSVAKKLGLELCGMDLHIS